VRRFTQSAEGTLRILLILIVAMAVGAAVILLIGQNPLDAYGALLKGAFSGKRNFGTTLANFTPLLLTGMAFAIASKAGAFNVGVEGEVFLGGIAAAWVGIYVKGLPALPHLLLCFFAAMAVGAVWAIIPALLKAYYNVSEICVTILMNYVALFITSYLVTGPMSAGVANAQSLPVLITLNQFMKPSSVNTGLFIAMALAVGLILMMSGTRLGYKIRMVGTNPMFAGYAGIDPKGILVKTMMISGAIGGIAGSIEILGVHGYFLNNFAAGLGSNGMLAALIVKNDMVLVPFMAMFLAILKSGAMTRLRASSSSSRRWRRCSRCASPARPKRTLIARLGG
jgi:simple sugar transport system permease protein